MARLCIDCSYDLSGLGVSRCPECGRRFNPRDRSTYDLTGPEGRHRFLPRILLLFALVPLAALMTVHANWYIAWIELGHRPRVELDKPGAVSGIVRIVAEMLLALSLPAVSASLVALLLGVLVAEGPDEQIRRNAAPLTLTIIVAAILLIMFSWDPLSVFAWLRR